MTITKHTYLLCLSLALPAACDDASSPEAEASSGAETDSADDPSAGSGSTTGSPSTSDPVPGTSGDDTGESDDDDGSTSSPADTDAETTGTEPAAECGPEGVPCEDAMILDLGLVGGSVSEGAVGNAADGAGWISSVDATAGGIVDAPSNPWVYLRFTDDGLEKVDLDDLEALASTDWHIAAKRFGIRINSGVSGPGCVTVATAADDEYETLAALPEDATLRSEAFYDESCGFIDDGAGAGGANFALTPWWFYPGCVGVTYVPFVIELGEDGRHVKFMVESYYESGQAECNESGAMGSGSANFTWRWAFID